MALLVLLCLSTPAALGQVTGTWSTSSGNWTTPAEWSCVPGPGTCLPNNNSNTYAAVVNSPGNTLTLDSTSSPTSISINTLSLDAGTLNIGSGATLNLTNQPSGITDIPLGAGLSLEGTIEIGGNPDGLAGLTTVEGTLTLANNPPTYPQFYPVSLQTNTGTVNVQQDSTLTDGAPLLKNMGTVNVQQDSTLNLLGGSQLANTGTVNLQQGATLDAGYVVNGGTINVGNDGSYSKVQVSYSLVNTSSINLNGTGDSLIVSGANPGLGNSGSINLNGTGASLYAAVLQNSGSINLNGFNENLQTGDAGLQGGSVSLTGNYDFVTVANNFDGSDGATLSLSGDHDSVTVNGSFTNTINSPQVVMSGTNGSIAVTGAFANNSGTVSLAGSGNTLSAGSFTNGDHVSLTGSGNTLSAGSFTNAGTVTIGQPENVNITNNSIAVTGAFTNNSGTVFLTGSGNTLSAGSFTNAGTVLVGQYENANVTNNNFAVTGAFTNSSGTVILAGNGNTLSAGSFTNAGTVLVGQYMGVNAANNSIAVTGAFTNNGGTVTLAGSGDTLSAGTFSNAGAVTVGSSETLKVLGTYTQTGGTSSTIVNGTLNAAADFSLTNGSVNVSNGGQINVDATAGSSGAGFTNNNGSVTIASGGNVTVNQNNYTQSGGSASLKVNGAMVVGTATINGGMVSGSGNITGTINNVGGTVTASDPGIPDILTIHGNYTQGSGGILEAFLAGTTPGIDYSQLDVVGGTATLGGTLDLDLVRGSGLVITPGESFDLVTATGCGVADCVTGSFSSVVGLPTLPSGDTWDVSFSGGSMDLTLEGSADYYAPTATPEPSAFLLLAIGIALLTILCKYRNTVRMGVE